MLGATDTAVAVATQRTSATVAEPSDAASPAIDMVGATLSGRYLVTRKVGQGGMGAVYEATHTLIGKRVAVKVLLEKYAKREAIVARLKQEAQLASSVNNEHIIDVTDFGTTDDGRTFVVMEFLEGESLAECLARETRLPEQRLLRIVHQSASALAAAHAKGIVHRDIKPENLFLLRRKEQDFVKVVDFGISKSLRSSSEEEEQPRLTQTGMVLGTPLYMSPEQARGDDELDHRVDIYALGVIMYEAASGRVPFVGNNYLSVISQVLNEEPPSLRGIRPELSEEFEAIVQRAMAKDRSDRYASAAEMLTDIGAVIDDPTHSTERARITGPRRRLPRKSSLKIAVWIGAIALVLISLVLVVNFMMGGSPSKKVVVAAPADAAVAMAPDAGPPPAAPDAPAEPAYEMLTLRVVTTPPGATILKDGMVQEGVSPMSISVVKKDKEVRVVAQLAGYEESPLVFNPLELKDATLRFPPMKKLPRGTPARPPTRQGQGSAAGSTAEPPPNRTGGELSGYPGGAVPKKK
ncbi:MAG: serine/threonine protein kinase [Kofleriaceae bacterium]